MAIRFKMLRKKALFSFFFFGKDDLTVKEGLRGFYSYEVLLF